MEELLLAKEIGFVSTFVFTFVQAVKMAGMNSKYAPILSILSGSLIAFAMGLNPVYGLIGGFTASGLYSGVKGKEKSESFDLESE